MVPLASDAALFTHSSHTGTRYLVVTRTPTGALTGQLLELLLRRQVAPLDTLALLASSYGAYQSGRWTGPVPGEGVVLVYSATYQYLTGHRFQHGHFVAATARLAFHPHLAGRPGASAPSRRAAPNGAVTASFTQMPDLTTCTDWYDGNTGGYLTTTGDCGGWDGADYVPPYTGPSTTGPGGYAPNPTTGGGGSVPSPAQTNEIVNNLTPCLTQVYNSLKGAISLYNTQTTTNGTSSAFLPISYFSNLTNNWQLGTNTLKPGTSGSTISDFSNNIVKTYFDPQQLQNATDLSVMTTMMHESVHAYLVAYYANDPNRFGAEYPILVQAFLYPSQSGQNNTQHSLIVSSFKNEIGKILFNYCAQLGYKADLQYCQDLAWNGLEHTEAYQSLTQREKNRISESINNEYNNVNAKGTKSSGC
jgi:hypothetical protein